MEMIAAINGKINGIVWGLPMMFLILGVGIYLTVGCGFPQFSHFIHIMKNTLGKAFEKSEQKEGAVSPFKAMCTALAASIGTGNIAGVSGAIAIGGPGAVFWMWMSALLGMCTKFSEVTLAVHFRERNAHGDYVGGPMYYIKNGLGSKWMWLAYLYAFFGVCAVFGTGNATQVNTITTAINTALLNYNVISADSTGTVSLVLGGGLSNLLERLRHGKVYDYLAFPKAPKPVNRYVYNLADIAILIGGLLWSGGKKR